MQAGDGLDLDITQDGQENKVGNSTTDFDLDGDTITFNITQTGSYNTIDALIKGDTYTGTWVFTGDTNVVDLKCSSVSSGSCDTVTLNVTTTGDDNTYDFDIGETANSTGSTIGFTVTGDDNIIDTTIDGKDATLAVTLNNSNSLSTGSTAGDAGIEMTTIMSGDGDSSGHSSTVSVTGGGGFIDITQAGVYDNVIDITIQGDGFDVDISQDD